MLIRENVLKEISSISYNGFEFQEIPNISKINLRGNSLDKEFITNASKVLETLLPIKPNSINNNNNLKIIWLSPNEWLIEIFDNEDFKKIFQNLNKSLNSENTAVTDVTENKTILQLSGNDLYKLLSKFMIIDLDKVLNKELAVAQTIFIKVPVLIIRNHKINTKQNISMYINRSHTQYILDLLIDGSQNIEF